MRHGPPLAFALCALLAVSAAAADDLPTSIVEYFTGKWRMAAAGGQAGGTVEWRKVAGGKAIAGAGKHDNGDESYSMAGWDLAKKSWLHSWFISDGSSGRLEITKFENNVYSGKGYQVDAEGKTVSGAWRARIIDADHVETTQETDAGPIVTAFERIRQ